MKTWELLSTKPVTADYAREYQYQHGYHPAGYGFYRFECRETPWGQYIATWLCSMSCE